MRVALVAAFGGPEQIRFVERDAPEPGAGELRVRVEAAGVNFLDVYHRTGLYGGELPFALGREGAGVVEALGAGVSGFAAGERVAWTGVPGSYATHVVARAEDVVKVPAGLDVTRAAAVLLQGLTAHYLTRSTWPLRRGERCLIHAAAGGVGLLFCQMARMVGAEVFGTVSSDEKARLAREAGATHVIDYTRLAFDEEVGRVTGGALLEVVYDSVGRTTFEKSLRCLRPRGLFVSFGQSSGPVPSFAPRVLSDHGSLFFTRPTLRDYTRTREELESRAGEVLGWAASGAIAVRIHAVLPLDRAADAQRLLESRATTGKLVLQP
ncbi:MAG: quinone oxidoreductase [Myxococcales bacterium]|nr:quinone oxidoreductase [Myxococcales bacterium]